MFKTRLDTFGNDFGGKNFFFEKINNFEKRFWAFFHFFENFRRLDPHGTLGKKNFGKN